jgi:predicted transcriptional regulator
MNSPTPTTPTPAQFGRFTPCEHQEISDIERGLDRALQQREQALAHLRYTLAQLDRAYTVERCDLIDAIRSSTTYTPRPALAQLQQQHDESLTVWQDAERAYRNQCAILAEALADCVARTSPQRPAQADRITP